MPAVILGISQLGINVHVLIAQIINFTILLIVLRALLYKPILKTLDQRRQRVEESLLTADRVKQQAAESEQESARALEEARKEGQAFIAQAQEIASRIQADARSQAQTEAEAMLERARNEIGLERDSAIAQLRHEFADLTILAAEKVIGQSLDRKAHERLIAEVLAESNGTGTDHGAA